MLGKRMLAQQRLDGRVLAQVDAAGCPQATPPAGQMSVHPILSSPAESAHLHDRSVVGPWLRPAGRGPFTSSTARRGRTVTMHVPVMCVMCRSPPVAGLRQSSMIMRWGRRSARRLALVTGIW